MATSLRWIRAYARRDDIAGAIQDYDRAIDLDPSEVTAYCHRGLAYAQQGQTDLAIEDFNTAIVLDPKCANAYGNRGNARLINGELELGIQDCTAAILFQSNDAISYFNRGVAELCLSRYGEAKRDLRAAQDLGYDVLASFHREHGTVADLEKKCDIRVPSDISGMLALPG